MRVVGMMSVLLLGATAVHTSAQAPAGGQGRAGRGGPQFDPAAVERGQKQFVGVCASCHGANAKGGPRGADLIRSVLVLDDENGKQLGEFLAVGRPENGMPKFNLSPEQVSDIATFLHREVAAAANRGSYKILDIVVGDAKAGENYFNGAGKCNTCHSPEGDLKAVGAKYDPVTLQGRIVMPRGRGGFGAGRGFGFGRGGSAEPSGPVTTVKVTLPSGQSISGALERMTDFYVTVRDSSGLSRTFTRDGDAPKVEVTDPLQAHIDMLAKYKDADIHNLTAYLVTLK